MDFARGFQKAIAYAATSNDKRTREGARQKMSGAFVSSRNDRVCRHSEILDLRRDAIHKSEEIRRVAVSKITEDLNPTTIQKHGLQLVRESSTNRSPAYLGLAPA